MSETSAYLSDFRPRFRQPSAADLCTPAPCLTTESTNERVLEVFTQHRELSSLPVVEAHRPIGLINRNIFLSQISKPYRLDMYGRKSCIAFMDKEPLIVDASMDIEALTFKAVEFGEKALSDGPNSWPLARMESLLKTLVALDRLVKNAGFEELE